MRFFLIKFADYKFSLDKTIKIVYTETVKTITLVRRRIYI